MITKLKKRNNDSIGVLGSGLMGHGIVYAAAISGFRVLMLDLTKKQAAKGLQNIYQTFFSPHRKKSFPYAKFQSNTTGK